MGVHVTSDLTMPWSGTVRWSLETLSGEVVVSGQDEVTAAPLASTEVCTLDFVNRVSEDAMSDLPTPRDVIFVCELWQGDQRVALQAATLAPSKHLSLAAPRLSVEVSQQDDELVFTVAAEQILARFVELALEGVDVVFSDNYFDLPAGREVSVTCPLPEGWTLERARRALHVRSLYDSFA
jgi:beta-mannosidase